MISLLCSCYDTRPACINVITNDRFQNATSVFPFGTSRQTPGWSPLQQWLPRGLLSTGGLVPTHRKPSRNYKLPPLFLRTLCHLRHCSCKRPLWGFKLHKMLWHLEQIIIQMGEQNSGCSCLWLAERLPFAFAPYSGGRSTLPYFGVSLCPFLFINSWTVIETFWLPYNVLSSLRLYQAKPPLFKFWFQKKQMATAKTPNPRPQNCNRKWMMS